VNRVHAVCPHGEGRFAELAATHWGTRGFGLEAASR
jgi:hypothetical protein